MTTFLLWSDLETTGLDPVKDEIIEAAFVLTDVHLDEIDSLRAIRFPGPDAMVRLLDNRVVLDMHRANGLLDELLDIKDRRQSHYAFNEDILAFLTRNGVLDAEATELTHQVHLAGSGVAAFDRRFIDRHLPIVGSVLHYAPIDVGTGRRLWKWETGSELTADEGSKTHRAMDDVRGHLREARALRTINLKAQAYDQERANA